MTPFERVALRIHASKTPVAWADATGTAGVFIRALTDGRIRVLLDTEACTANGIDPDTALQELEFALSCEDFEPAVDQSGVVWIITGTLRPPIPKGLTPRQGEVYAMIRRLGSVKSGRDIPLRTLRELEAKGLIVVRSSSTWRELHPEGGWIGELTDDVEAAKAAYLTDAARRSGQRLTGERKRNTKSTADEEPGE
ncbi:hypothetical protein [Nonomuraea typhae]|uniref:Uncharacterized protein n=1 Tax=Nonomuraea typhae TaxID=2603600 RepID=A0ABW7YJE3_9ACTN